MRERHATFFLQVRHRCRTASRWCGAALWLERLETEHHNLRAALTFFIEREPARALCLALAVNPFWEARAHFVEGRVWLERALEPVQMLRRSWRARAAGAAGRLAWYQEDYHAARAPLEESLGLFEALGERRSAVVTLGSLGQLAVAEGDYVRARALCERAVAEARTLGDKQVLAGQLRDFGTVAGALFDVATARAGGRGGLVLCRELGDSRGVAHALMGLGMADAYSGDARRARGRLFESLVSAAPWATAGWSAVRCSASGHAERTLGDFTTAHRHYHRALDCAENRTPISAGNCSRSLRRWLRPRDWLFVRLGCSASEAFHEARRFPMLPYLQAEHDHAVATARARWIPTYSRWRGRRDERWGSIGPLRSHSPERIVPR